MAPRSQLQARLESVCPDQVYFQPPADVQLQYPAIVYRRSLGKNKFANNKSYMFSEEYEVTLISRDPDTDALREQLRQIPLSNHDVFFVADNLNHDVYTIYN